MSLYKSRIISSTVDATRVTIPGLEAAPKRIGSMAKAYMESRMMRVQVGFLQLWEMWTGLLSGRKGKENQGPYIKHKEEEVVLGTVSALPSGS